jgi:pyruvate dehydrogenase E1 component alpha subunit
VEEATKFALDSKDPDVASAVEDVYTDIVEEAR